MISAIIALMLFIRYFVEGGNNPELLIAGAILWLSGNKPNIKVINEIRNPNRNDDGIDK